MTRRNPSEERLLAYAAGALSPPEAVVIAAHLALRPANDAWVRRLQTVGGAFLEDTPPAGLSDDALARALARIETDGGEARVQPPLNDMPELPEPLRRYDLGPWRWIGPGIRARDVSAPRDGACRVILLRIDPGREAPRHTHGGVELTCVLSGAYATETERFDVGDLEEADHEVLHQPRVVSDVPCLCVVALDGQIHLEGWLGRLMQPFVRL
ncbi:MAG: ChrR family anti-sigma-E factor [Brevundimonas sp.]|uniref:cadmium/peroxide/UV radiation responsive anti-sigma factor ChrR n=1 Tax=Brevundimonas sp. TaxID=1871086 RepID=UPI002723D146|nr:ChrR family anti-sigma-E factor [Brevundimonas sp.]MDO9586851.1 ChrR family anti-sigma-E factor [Brevundimonas sp.]MDP3369111.1 ChrR family anti-sigma-E factor [Brevundimonas sp.]MDZ4113199.1 ChrR family anti-sigma-E factor [Brevundimonas sp.]